MLYHHQDIDRTGGILAFAVFFLFRKQIKPGLAGSKCDSRGSLNDGD